MRQRESGGARPPPSLLRTCESVRCRRDEAKGGQRGGTGRRMGWRGGGYAHFTPPLPSLPQAADGVQRHPPLPPPIHHLIPPQLLLYPITHRPVARVPFRSGFFFPPSFVRLELFVPLFCFLVYSEVVKRDVATVTQRLSRAPSVPHAHRLPRASWRRSWCEVRGGGGLEVCVWGGEQEEGGGGGGGRGAPPFHRSEPLTHTHTHARM